MTQVTITVYGVGLLRTVLGETGTTLTCGPRAGDATAALAAIFPQIAALDGAVALATDTAWLAADAPLHEGMTLTLIPPISGG